MIAIHPKTYLRDAIVYDAAEFDDIAASDESVRSVDKNRSPLLCSHDGLGQRLLLPVCNGSTLLSVVSLQIGNPDEVVGVTEIWEPVGRYEEVKLTAGAFGKLERFQNVSSFVRFEKGNGLPGQVWQTGRSTIHDDLANHPGFLRAAGASAGSLQTAIGIPVFSDRFIATVVVIGSEKAPIATACEVWTLSDQHFKLHAACYGRDAGTSQFELGQSMSSHAGLFGAIQQHGGAVLVTEPELLMDSRPDWKDFTVGLAIPAYEENQIASVTLLLF